jgi:hypothetical protein
MSRMLMISGLFAAAFAVRVGSAQHSPMPPGATHEEHLAQVQKEAQIKKRGAVAMGFDQDTTTHHFRLTPMGGFIQVEVNDPADATGRDSIRAHLKEITGEFTSGDFSKPFQTHDETPPGVAIMQELKSRIAYRFEETGGGGRVRISTTSSAALSAVHDFLRYQIREHATGDPLAIVTQ